MNAPSPLTSFSQGETVRLLFMMVDVQEAQRLRELGIREGATFIIMQNSDKLILAIVDNRIGLRREIGMKLFATGIQA